MYSYMETKTPAEVASKILAYSREVEISKVIEVIGGKEERNKVQFHRFKVFIENYGGILGQNGLE
jgi:hypothetical protein